MFNVSEKQKFDRYHYSIFVDSFLNHDYTEEDEKDEFKVSFFLLLQCNHGSETNQQYSITRNLFQRINTHKIKKLPEGHYVQRTSTGDTERPICIPTQSV